MTPRDSRPPFPLCRWLLTAACCLLPAACRADWNELSAATCRVTSEPQLLRGGLQAHDVGTGCLCQVSSYAMVLTNHHVVKNSRVVTCDFWHGPQIERVMGQVYASDAAIDAALILIPKTAFRGGVPAPLKMADRSPAAGETVYSFGCAAGEAPQAFVGRVLGYSGHEVWFAPAPAQGRSGSAVVDGSGRIVGLLKWATRDQREGAAVDLPTLHAQLANLCAENCQTWMPCAELIACYGQQSAPITFAGASGVCAVSCCPSCPQQDGIFFHRQPEPQPLTPWPAPTPAPTVDFTPLQQQLGAIADELRHNQVPQGPDPQVLQALQAHGAALEQLKSEVPKQIDAAVKPVSEKVGTIEATVKPLLALHKKLEADAQAGGLKGKLAQQVLDASEGGEDVAAKIHKELFIVLAVLAVLAVIAFGVIHLVKTGHGPLGQVLDKLAAAQPANATLQQLAAKVDSLDASLAAKLNAAGAATALAGGNLPAASADAVQQIKDHLTALLTPAPGQSAAAPAAAVSTPAPAAVATPAIGAVNVSAPAAAGK